MPAFDLCHAHADPHSLDDEAALKLGDRTDEENDRPIAVDDDTFFSGKIARTRL